MPAEQVGLCFFDFQWIDVEPGRWEFLDDG